MRVRGKSEVVDRDPCVEYKDGVVEFGLGLGWWESGIQRDEGTGR